MEFTFATVLPIVTLAALGVAVPIALARQFPDSLAGLARALALSVVVMILAGTGLFVLLYRDAGLNLALIAEQPSAAARHFLWLGLKAGIVWAPVLALTALTLGQGIETRRGQRLAARDRED